MDPFQALWQRFHPDAVPIGRTFEASGTWNLTRFHLLPNGQDAALSRAELRGLMHRFNLLATEVLGDGQPVWLIVPDAEAPEWAPPEIARAMKPSEARNADRERLRRLKARYGLTTRWDFYSADDKCVYKVEAAEITWRSHGFARLFLDIYNERLRDVVLMNAQSGAVIAPNTAGLRVSQPTPQALMDLVRQYYGWLPTAGDGVLRFNPAQMSGGNFQVPKACAAAIQRALGTA